ncbi:TonB family protein [Halalkalibaculum sp. DA3122]|uniref:TonB family protein n=1 Tax=unclassified Halalkalibaculum TaxID=2964617 RepID=UPI0037548EC3
MTELTSLVTEWGHLSLDRFWFPLLIWSLFALLVHLLLKWKEPREVLYQYHLRVALVSGIPIGILASFPIGWLSGLFTKSPEAAGQFSLLVLQNPIVVSSATAGPANSIAWGDPYLWIGLVTSITAFICLVMLARTGWHYSRITRFARTLDTTNLRGLALLNAEDHKFANSIYKTVSVAYSNDTEIPFTFGWRAPVIIIPGFLKREPEKCRMAIRHELMHIKRGDFLVNGFMTVMRSLLWFHPLIHAYDREIKEAREISCDSDVLTDQTISRKKYAQLLFELAPRQEAYARQLVSMSVNKSTLQKRIKTMTTFNNTSRPFKKSIIVSLALLLAVSGIIACSDLQDNGITNSELQQTQAQIQHLEGEKQPLYIIREDTDLDGTYDTEEFATTEESQKISRIKGKYIKALNVYKGEQAIEKYGQQGANGVVILNLLNKEKAFSDLKSPDEVQQPQKAEKEFFVVVEQMPELKGGLTSLQQCVNYPEEARRAGIEGRVIVQFIVNEQGNVESPQIIRGIGGGADEEAIRCVKTAQFEPGKQRGNPVRVQYSLPITFKLPASETETNSPINVEQMEVNHQQLELVNLTRKNGSITAQVVDKETRNPVPGANVIIKNTSIGASTDDEGIFTLDRLPNEQDQIVISHIRYEPWVINLY